MTLAVPVYACLLFRARLCHPGGRALWLALGRAIFRKMTAARGPRALGPGRRQAGRYRGTPSPPGVPNICEADERLNTAVQMRCERSTERGFVLSPGTASADQSRKPSRCFFRIKGKLSHVTSHFHGGTPAANMTCMAKFSPIMGSAHACRSRPTPLRSAAITIKLSSKQMPDRFSLAAHSGRPWTVDDFGKHPDNCRSSDTILAAARLSSHPANSHHAMAGCQW